MTDHLVQVPRPEIGRQVWDAFVETTEEAWLWHRYDLIEALLTWPGRSDLSFGIVDGSRGERVVAVVPLNLVRSRSRIFLVLRSLESLGGPACANGMGDGFRRKVLDKVQAELLRLAANCDVGEINLSLPSMAPAWRGLNCPRVNPLLFLGCENTLTQTWIVDLRCDKESLWKGLEGRTRTTIKKALKEGTEIREANLDSDLDIYYSLHRQTYERTGQQPHAKAYFAHLWQDFFSRGLAQIFFAHQGGHVVAAETFAVYKQGAFYWTGATEERGLKTGANALLQWAAIQWMVDKGLSCYETGEAYPHLKEGKLKGISDFKKSLGGSLYPFYKGRLDPHTRVSRILKAGRLLKALIR